VAERCDPGDSARPQTGVAGLLVRLWLAWFVVPPLCGVIYGITAVIGGFLRGAVLRWPSLDALGASIPTAIPVWLTGLVVISLFRHIAAER